MSTEPERSGSGAANPARSGAREEPWYVEAFRADYRRVYPHRDLVAARLEVDYLLSRGLGGRVLDLGAGFGRHTLALRERGVRAFGLDLSAELLAGAGALGGGDRLRGRMARGDARRLPFAQGSFDGLAMLFSSFGYFDDAGNEAVLAEARRVLVPGGLLVLDLMSPERVRSGLVPRSEREGDDYALIEERRLTHGGRRVEKTVRLVDRRGERSWREDVRLFEPAEIDVLLAARGLLVEARDGDFDGRAFGPGAPRQIVRARRETRTAG